MPPIQRLTLNLFAALFLLAALTLVIQNLAVLVPLQVLTYTLHDFPLGAGLAITALFLGLGVFLKMTERLQGERTQARKANRELERTEVTAEESGQRVKALEAKIQTLEKALSEALKVK